MPLDVYEGAGDQPHRWRVTNEAAVPEVLADSGEGYTERRGAYEGAGHALEQLLRHHPDAERIAIEWLGEDTPEDEDEDEDETDDLDDQYVASLEDAAFEAGVADSDA